MDTVQLIAFVLTSLHCRLLVHSSKPRKKSKVSVWISTRDFCHLKLKLRVPQNDRKGSLLAWVNTSWTCAFLGFWELSKYLSKFSPVYNEWEAINSTTVKVYLMEFFSNMNIEINGVFSS